MHPKIRTVLEMCIHEGIAHGYRRAFKHDNNPSEAWIVESIHNEIMNSIDLYFDFDNETA
jgi:hypothetical protein